MKQLWQSLQSYRKALLWAGMLLFSLSMAAQNQGVPFNGLVIDLQGKPLKKVRAWVNNSDRFTQTNKKGRFGLTDVQPTDILHLRYKKKDYDVPVEGRRSLRIRLADTGIQEAEESQELVDYGYGYVSQREYTSPSGRITGEELIQRGITTVSEALRGVIPGVSAQAVANNEYQSTSQMNIRGVSSLMGRSKPLFIVDGTEVDDLDYLNVRDIDYIEVQKTSSLYGSKGSAGVVIVKTKQ